MVTRIMDETVLFYGGSLDQHIEETMTMVKESVDSMQRDKFRELSDEDICNELLEIWKISFPEIDKGGVELVEDKEIKVDVSDDRSYDIPNRNKPFYNPGHSYTFSIPFSGDRKYFYLRGQSGPMNHPLGTLQQNEIHITIETSDTDATNVKNTFDDQLKSINAFLPSIQQRIKDYNENLPSAISRFISLRRERLEKVENTVKSMGVPIRRKDKAPIPFKIPESKKKIRIKKIAKSKSMVVAERSLSMEDFDSILSDIEGMAQIFEQDPSAFNTMGEEALRWLFLIPLNIQYDSVTGETFHFGGKTDILIKADGKNVFIAECKIWDGPKSLAEAIDQLLSYSSWRDTKLAILVFNRNKIFSKVIEKVKETIPNHKCFVGELNSKGETHFRFTFHNPNDKDRLVNLAVLIFDVPT